MAYSGLFSIFLVGLLGGVHCAGMCGGIAGALSLQARVPTQRWRIVLTYNLGRIATYTLAGALAGGLGALLLRIPGLATLQWALFVLTQVMLLALGLYLLGVSRVTTALESLGGALWRHLQPLTLPLFPVRTAPRAFLLGSLWGFIPCGLVYSALITAAASADLWTGARILLAFGLGTLPTLLAMGLGASTLQSRWKTPAVRGLAGTLVAGFGVWGLVRLATGQVVIMPGSVCVSGF